MISMKLTAAEAKADTMLGDAEEDGGPQYPYGLKLCLDDDELAKLGITELPAIGAVFYIEAKAEVCSTSQYANQKDTDASVSLQITDMSLSTTDDDADKPGIASRLYGGQS